MAFSSGASRAGGRVCVRVMLRALMLLAVVTVALGAPRDAEAAIYIWKNVDGSWTNANNWTPVGVPAGFPNAAGDQAFFTDTYTATRTVTIPTGTTITVGTIVFADAAIRIAADGSGTLRLDNGASRAEITRLGVPPTFTDVISAPIVLRNDTDILISDAGATILISGAIANSGCACGITKKALGRLILRGNNSYLGTTSVERGLLLLDLSDNVVIEGSLEIGSGVAGPGVVAEVLVTKSNQISDTSRVLVKSQGLLTVDIAEQVGDVIVNDGFITIRTTVGALVPASLTLSGGIIESRAGANILLEGPLTATSSAKGPARIFRSSTDGVLLLGATTRVFTINDGPSSAHDLTIDLPITSIGTAGLIKQGSGTLRFTGSNTYAGDTQVQAGNLWLEPPAGGQSVTSLTIGHPTQSSTVSVRLPNAVADTARVSVGANGSFWINTTTPERIGPLDIFKGGSVLVGNFTSGARLVTPALSMEGGRVQSFFDNNTLEVTTTLKALSKDQETAVISGGNLVLGGERKLEVLNGPAAIDLRVSSNILGGAADGLSLVGPGVTVLEGRNSYGGETVIASTVRINGQQPASPITLTIGALGGIGTVGPITADPSGMGLPIVSPGESPGRLSSGSIAFTPNTTFELELNDPDLDASDQLAVTGTVNLSNARLQITGAPALPRGGRWIIIDNDGTDPVVGTFFQRPEGRQIEIGSHEYLITYRGGDGNDVVIESLAPLTYYLAEGATGDFFDDDVLIANPNNQDATATLTFLREGGATVVVQRVVPARARITVHVEEIEGLENASASVEVKTDAQLPLIVERTMFWDQSYYGGHTANAMARPERQWTFAEGFQGFFDTYILIANTNATTTTATLTFLRENDTPVVKTVDVAPFARKTVYAGDYDELKGRAFGIVVDAPEPVIAERAMYFATQGNRLWAGGHVNSGIVAPSRSWFHAEGATGTFFNTFILLSNPQSTEAKVDVQFLLDNGTVITRPKTLAPQQRLTINPAAEGDSRLENAALSTVVQSDVPIVSERSMYWLGDASPLGEGHNSSGVTETGLRWGLAEGRVGGDRVFDTYILLANPSNTASRVRVTYLRESGAAIVKEYDVPATSRFNIDVKTVVPELQNSSFGADIEVLNDVPIVVERSLYWNAIGAFWAGGTNALATPLRPVP